MPTLWHESVMSKARSDLGLLGGGPSSESSNDEGPEAREVKRITTNPRFLLQRGWHDTAGPFAGRVRRGALVSVYPDEDGTQWMLYFMLNPSVVSHTFNMNLEGIHAAEGLSEAAMAANAHAHTRSTSLDLFFDRTLEVAEDNSNRGVELDIEVLYRMIGIEDVHYDVPIPMRQVTAYIVREEGSTLPGVAPQGDRGRETSVVNLMGWITGLQVTYSAFAANMTPTRAVANIDLMQVLKPKGGAGGSAVDGADLGGDIGRSVANNNDDDGGGGGATGGGSGVLRPL